MVFYALEFVKCAISRFGDELVLDFQRFKLVLFMTNSSHIHKKDIPKVFWLFKSSPNMADYLSH